MAETHADRMNKDKSSFTQLVKDEFRLSVKVTNCFRVGRAVTGKHRLLIVTLDDEETKWDIIRQASQLRHSDRWPRVYLTPDLTRSEREEGRKLREELKKRRDNGEQNLTIRNRKIVESDRGRPAPVPKIRREQAPADLGSRHSNLQPGPQDTGPNPANDDLGTTGISTPQDEGKSKVDGVVSANQGSLVVNLDQPQSSGSSDSTSNGTIVKGSA